MTFRLSGLDPAPFQHLFGLSDDALARVAARRYAVDVSPGFPDRVELRDLRVGEVALLVNHMHQPAATAYRASHAILVREGATEAVSFTGAIPEVIRSRPISLRAFDGGGEMVDADLVDGAELAPVIGRMLAHGEVAYLHAHYARRGCYAALIERG